MFESKKVAVILADGFEEMEALCTVDVIRRSNIKCEMVSIKNEYVQSSHGVIIKADRIITEIDKKEYTMIVLPGGLPGADNLRDSDEIIEWVKDFVDSNKYVAAICAAPQVLAKADVVKGKNVTSYPDNVFREILKDANYIENPNEGVVVDGNIVTSMGPATVLSFAYKLVDLLGGNSDILKKGMLYTNRTWK